jgi:gluconolactonase
MPIRRIIVAGLAAALFAGAGVRAADDAPTGKPDATIDVATADGVKQTRGEWRYSDVKIVEVEARGPDGKPAKTYDLTPHAEATDYDDSKWPLIDPTTLGERRAAGKVCFAWYRIKATIPERIGEFATAGSTVVFDTVADDYGEIWIDGKLPKELGQSGGSVIKGWNAPNRLVIGKDVKPGQTIQIAVFAINGPISASPENYIFLRYAKLDFYKPVARGDADQRGWLNRYLAARRDAARPPAGQEARPGRD